ncbi:MAG: hypothetical protein ACK40M_08605 [Flavobacteriales bacterium]
MKKRIKPVEPVVSVVKLERTRFEDLDDRLLVFHLFRLGQRYVEAEMEAIYFGGPFGARVFYSLN